MRFLIQLALCLLPAAATAAPAHYRVIMPDTNAPHIRVVAAFDLESEVIAMMITRSPQLPNGQADLIRNLQVERSGEKLAIEDLGTGDWKLANAVAGERVHVGYEIALEHGDYDWGPGIDEVAYRTSEGLFFTGRSLFIVPGPGMPDGARVEFELPEGWSASVPWPMNNGVALADDSNQLLRNCLFLGSHRTETVELDGFRFTMVIGEDLWDQRELFVAAMEPVLPASLSAFGGMPRENEYLVVFNRGDRADGGAFASSYSMLLKGHINEASSVIWGHGVAHELIHFWNGHSMVPASMDQEWLKEGFTDYFTILLRSRSGLDSPETTWRKVENTQRRYVIAKMLMGSTSTLQQAGHNKHKERFLVYGGGTLVGMVLDVKIRQATANERGIDDFLAMMFAEFGDGQSRYSLDDIVRMASELCGEDLDAFFANYVAGDGFLDLTPTLEAIGLQLDTMADEFYVSVAPGASAQQVAMREAMFGR
jgi:predicted metalloprotease with PDZ domain